MRCREREPITTQNRQNPERPPFSSRNSTLLAPLPRTGLSSRPRPRPKVPFQDLQRHSQCGTSTRPLIHRQGARSNPATPVAWRPPWCLHQGLSTYLYPFYLSTYLTPCYIAATPDPQVREVHNPRLRPLPAAQAHLGRHHRLNLYLSPGLEPLPAHLDPHERELQNERNLHYLWVDGPPPRQPGSVETLTDSRRATDGLQLVEK